MRKLSQRGEVTYLRSHSTLMQGVDQWILTRPFPVRFAGVNWAGCCWSRREGLTESEGWGGDCPL